jgi:hypothetical protein
MASSVRGWLCFMAVCLMIYLARGRSQDSILARGPVHGTDEADLVRLMSIQDLLHCLRALDPPWLAVYGDSLTRGIFFNIVSLLNGSDSQVVPPTLLVPNQPLHHVIPWLVI